MRHLPILWAVAARTGGAGRSTGLTGQSVAMNGDACVRLLNSSATIGCATPAGGLVAPVHVLLTEAEVLGMKARARKGEVRRMIDDLGSHSSAIYTSQERLRANIKSLEKMPGSDLMARYMRDLDREEDDLIQTRAKIEEHTSTLNGLLDELEASWVELVNLASALKESTPFGGE